MEASVYLVYTTCGSKEDARKIALSLVESRLSACVNIIPAIYSIYWWKNKIEEENEVLILAKTTKERIREVINKIKEIHPYELPDIIAFPVTEGYRGFLRYVERETS